MANNHRGFAAMDPERQREIARKGGRASHAHGHAHEWTSAEAAEAGRKGGRASRSGSARNGARSRPRRNTGTPGIDSSQKASPQNTNESMDPTAAPKPAPQSTDVEQAGSEADIAGRGQDANTDERSGSERGASSSVDERSGASRMGGRDMDERSGEPPATEAASLEETGADAPNPSLR